MPRFFFNFLGGNDSAADEVGCEFDDLDLAYLDAYRSMVRIGADLLLEQKDPSRHRIEITDASGALLVTLAFDEVFCRRPGPVLASPDGAMLRSQLASSRRLGQDIREACLEAHAAVAMAAATLGRAGASLRSRQGS